MELAQRLISTRRGTIFVAALAALLAAASIVVYLNRYRQSLQSGGALVTVLVAGDTIPRGTAGNVLASKGLYTASTIRESQLRDGAISDPASLQGTMAAREILEGSQLTTADFVPAGDSLAATLTDRERVVSIPLDAAHGLTEELQPGNRVDVYAAFNVLPLGPGGTPTDGGTPRAVLKLIMANVPVLALGENTRANGVSNVSLGVDDVKAADLTFAAENGSVWLALRPSAGAAASRPKLVTVETLMLGVPSVVAARALGSRR